MIIDFLETETSKEDLTIALQVLREFKSCESGKEHMLVPYDCWLKLEQLEEYLAYMAHDEPLHESTVNMLTHGNPYPPETRA